MYPLDDTIVAVSSPPGGAARGIVRLSGPDAMAVLCARFRPDCGDVVVPDDHATVTPGMLKIDGLASGLPGDAYLWPAGHSYTGQPVVELHTLGSPPLLDAAVATFCAAGARLAGPGEFTLRAFLAGRLDLTQAEAVLGVIDAADRRQLDVALAQLAGGLGGPLQAIRDELIDLLAHLEAGFDFADEDLAFIEPEQLNEGLEHATETVRQIAAQMASRDRADAVVRVVLCGPPNAGKSSLFNALAGKDDALVSPQAGTTRDYLTVELDFDGLRCLLVDTAGTAAGATPATGNTIDHAAQALVTSQHEQADVRIVCIDATRPGEEAIAEESAAGTILVATKVDAAPSSRIPAEMLETSSLTGQGIEALREAIHQAARQFNSAPADVVAGTALRCRESLRTAEAALLRAGEILRDDGGEELVAAEIRVALEELGKVVGAVYTDDVLDRVFSRFCIGK